MNPQQIISNSMQFDSILMKDMEDFHRPNENMHFSVEIVDGLPTLSNWAENDYLHYFSPFCSGGDN